MMGGPRPGVRCAAGLRCPWILDIRRDTEGATLGFLEALIERNRCLVIGDYPEESAELDRYSVQSWCCC